ncbi:MAG TPA: twin-arginine translocase subunit TatC [Vicinamibacterales bacterium]|nr:twin-arginine translocase subunit TatC [Vicinamibacterales bacterium]
MALVQFPGPQSGAYQPDLEDDEDGDAGKMSFLEHLDELRKRIVRALLGVCVGVLLSFAFINQIVNFLLTPTYRVLPAGSRMIYTQPGEAFGLYIQVSLITGVVLSAPWILWQVWLFIAPGLYTNEKRLAIPFVAFGTIGFIAGTLVNHYITFPFMMKFFASFNTPDLVFLPRLEDVFDLYTKMLLGMGLVFQMPTLVYSLAKMRLVSAKFLLRHFKYAFLIIFIIAAVITPTGDMVTQAIFAAPMVALYILSIFIAWIVRPRQEP